MKRLLKSIAKGIYYGGSSHECTVCGRKSKTLLPFGVTDRPKARCPWCNSLERHRLIIQFFHAKTNLFDGSPKRVLHVAPERFFAEKFESKLGEGYLTVDLNDEKVMEKMDICDIQYPDNTFDVIYCSHVLEHVPDDRLAMREMCRVLKPEGWAVLNVPITADTTFEDPSVTDPKERERLFGQCDHVRVYGPDYVDRLQESGFDVTVYSPSDVVPADKIDYYGVGGQAVGEIYYCTKSA